MGGFSRGHDLQKPDPLPRKARSPHSDGDRSWGVSHRPWQTPALNPWGLQLAASLAQRLRRYPGLPTPRRLDPSYAALILCHLRDWLRHVHRHLHLWTHSTLPSVPLLSGDQLLVIWNHVTPQSLPEPPAGTCWSYAPTGGSLALSLTTLEADPCPPAVLWAPTCHQCGRPLPLYSSILSSAGSSFASESGFCCWATPLTTPFTADSAARSFVSLGTSQLPGVLPTSHLRRHRCRPPSPPPPLPLDKTCTMISSGCRPGSGHHRRRRCLPPPGTPQPKALSRLGSPAIVRVGHGTPHAICSMYRYPPESEVVPQHQRYDAQALGRRTPPGKTPSDSTPPPPGGPPPVYPLCHGPHLFTLPCGVPSPCYAGGRALLARTHLSTPRAATSPAGPLHQLRRRWR